MRERGTHPGPAPAGRHAEGIEALRKAVFEPAAVTSREVRRAAALGGELADPLGAYLRKVRDSSYRVSDHDVDELRSAGHREEEIFELTVAAALGAALDRYDRAIGAMGVDA